MKRVLRPHRTAISLSSNRVNRTRPTHFSPLELPVTLSSKSPARYHLVSTSYGFEWGNGRIRKRTLGRREHAGASWGSCNPIPLLQNPCRSPWKRLTRSLTASKAAPFWCTKLRGCIKIKLACPPRQTPCLRRVPLDKSEGVVKRHLFAAMLSSTAQISERWRTEALKLSR